MDNASEVEELLRKFGEDGLEILGDPDHDDTIKIGHVTIRVVECESCIFCRSGRSISTNSTEDQEQQAVPNSEIIEIDGSDDEEIGENSDALQILPTTSNSALVKIPGILDEVEDLTEESLLPDLSGDVINAITSPGQDTETETPTPTDIALFQTGSHASSTSTENEFFLTDSPASPTPSESTGNAEPLSIPVYVEPLDIAMDVEPLSTPVHVEPLRMPIHVEPSSMDQSIESLLEIGDGDIPNVQGQSSETPNVEVDEFASNEASDLRSISNVSGTKTEISPLNLQSRRPEFNSFEQLKQVNLQQEAASGLRGNALGSFDNQLSNLWSGNTRPPLFSNPNRAFRPRHRYSSVYDSNPRMHHRPWSPYPAPPQLMDIPCPFGMPWQSFENYNYPYPPSNSQWVGYWR